MGLTHPPLFGHLSGEGIRRRIESLTGELGAWYKYLTVLVIICAYSIPAREWETSKRRKIQ